MRLAPLTQRKPIEECGEATSHQQQKTREDSIVDTRVAKEAR